MPNPLLYRPEDAAQALGIGRSKLYQLLAARRLQSVKIDDSRRIPAAALNALIDQSDAARMAIPAAPSDHTPPQR